MTACMSEMMSMHTITIRHLRVIATILIASICCSTAWARDKTDVIVLDNGDRITGEIKQLGVSGHFMQKVPLRNSL